MSGTSGCVESAQHRGGVFASLRQQIGSRQSSKLSRGFVIVAVRGGGEPVDRGVVIVGVFIEIEKLSDEFGEYVNFAVDESERRRHVAA